MSIIEIECAPEETGKCDEVHDSITNILDDLELKCDSFVTPKLVVRAEKCFCGEDRERFTTTDEPTQTLDGNIGKPNFVGTKIRKIRWVPFYRPPGQSFHKGMHCFKPMSAELRCELSDIECDCPAAEGPHQHYRRGTRHTLAEVAQDYCTSGMNEYKCPKDKSHKHWNAKKELCNWPMPCPAACLDHTEFVDWINNVPPPQKGIAVKIDRMFMNN